MTIETTYVHAGMQSFVRQIGAATKCFLQDALGFANQFKDYGKDPESWTQLRAAFLNSAEADSLHLVGFKEVPNPDDDSAAATIVETHDENDSCDVGTMEAAKQFGIKPSTLRKNLYWARNAVIAYWSLDADVDPATAFTSLEKANDAGVVALETGGKDGKPVKGYRTSNRATANGKTPLEKIVNADIRALADQASEMNGNTLKNEMFKVIEKLAIYANHS